MIGLDQYAMLRPFEGEDDEIAYWRKHPNLQGWMENLYREKGGEGEFNCVEVELTTEDINRLEEDIKDGLLPNTQGFFFGNDADEHYENSDLEFCANARKVLDADEGKIVYTSWW